MGLKAHLERIEADDGEVLRQVPRRHVEEMLEVREDDEGLVHPPLELAVLGLRLLAGTMKRNGVDDERTRALALSMVSEELAPKEEKEDVQGVPSMVARTKSLVDLLEKQMEKVAEAQSREPRRPPTSTQDIVGSAESEEGHWRRLMGYKNETSRWTTRDSE
jgi:hypothetical protein